ncbi:hypothetical protein CYLTODRAFT_418434 [Cylindrobasidium torrendii FP15055 ss-10]|uniref:Uncharacterized protein n=1 Tax=Cylindrobasidium torrendii FP15055 ss-10 TaxID=1314674 RepID=A0A0D7BQK7_9AGAR|nr:hypothetical protein CYLTODRAFT_418434 [Cylindrobasidium torrendii FP15055 ss-10]
MLCRTVILAVSLGSLLSVSGLGTPEPTTLWTYNGILNPDDPLNAGIETLAGVQNLLVHNGSASGRSYAHHAIAEYISGTLYLAWSSGLIDEDQNGQQTWIAQGSLSNEMSEWSFGEPRVVVGSALLTNQSEEANYTYWCDNNIVQRASQPNAVVPFEGEVYLITELVDIVCFAEGTSKYTVGAGRYIVPLSVPDEAGCWLSQTEYYTEHLYNQTSLSVDICPELLMTGLSALLERPDILPFTNARLINAGQFFASDGQTPLQEVTHAVWFDDGQGSGYWQRFWRDVKGSNNSLVNWVEFTSDPKGADWFPNTFTPAQNSIYASNIPDSNTKSFYGSLGSSRNGSLAPTYLVHNPQYYPETRWRQPLALTIAHDGVHFEWSRVLRTNGSTHIVPDTRGIKRVGFSYPHATLVGDELVVAYSEDKENIWISRVSLSSLG